MMEFPTPPDGYEVVDRGHEHGKGTSIGKDWLYLDWVDCRKWVLTRHAGTALFQMPADTIYARPIRKPAASPWVRASERQPPSGVIVATRVTDGAWCGCVGVAPIMHGLEWLDLDAVDRLAAENERLREELVDEREVSGARIAELEKELDQRRESDGENVRLRSELSRARDTEISLLRTVAQLRREKERGPVELTFGELVRMAVRDQSFDPEA